MTPLSRTIVTSGIVILTIGSIAWILTTNWQWFAAGLSIFFGSLLAGAVLSVEPKTPIKNNHTVYPQDNSPQHHPDDWQRPSEPPPTSNPHQSDDPFFS